MTAAEDRGYYVMPAIDKSMARPMNAGTKTRRA